MTCGKIIIIPNYSTCSNAREQNNGLNLQIRVRDVIVPAAMSWVAYTPTPSLSGASLMQKCGEDREMLLCRTDITSPPASSSTLQRPGAAVSLATASTAINAVWPFKRVVVRECSHTTVPGSAVLPPSVAICCWNHLLLQKLSVSMMTVIEINNI